MKSNFNPIALLTCLTLLSTGVAGLAQEKIRQAKPHPEQIELREMKQKVAEMRKKAVKLKEMGRMEDSEALAGEAKKLYTQLQERVGKVSSRREKDAEAKKRTARELAENLEHRMEASRRKSEGHGERVVERVIVRDYRDGGHDDFRERGSERRPEMREISPEDHVRLAIENLHAAGWHEVAERVEQEFHHRMEENHAREQGHGGPDLHRMMEALERRFEEMTHRFEEVHRQFEHLGQAVGESHARIDRLEQHLREREEHRE
ncbi:MAG: hypothetical protein O2964_03480 [Verrucomicrobia bacterium]|nr:hypothetical protein [Verrucomicrobiota bacterium]